ncbi:hypothetical protein CC86DRAFT_382605 [Ophiobolus disseminans]|uniref:Uncharacterized protein n=1 Tax=Ophiobolus disseminans TaxID=1469910 RepID=A0A6A6ZYR2_9PLEO|nr:hypothetical protein CC86DRAFT_382605 [Ophiobolus disseminans]
MNMHNIFSTPTPERESREASSERQDTGRGPRGTSRSNRQPSSTRQRVSTSKSPPTKKTRGKGKEKEVHYPAAEGEVAATRGRSTTVLGDTSGSTARHSSRSTHGSSRAAPDAMKISSIVDPKPADGSSSSAAGPATQSSTQAPVSQPAAGLKFTIGPRSSTGNIDANNGVLRGRPPVEGSTAPQHLNDVRKGTSSAQGSTPAQPASNVHSE